MKTLAVFLIFLFSYAVQTQGGTPSPMPPETSHHTFAPIISYSSTYKLILGGGYFNTPKQMSSQFLGLQVMGTFEKIFQATFDYRKFNVGPVSWGLNSKFSNFYDPYYGEGNSTRVDDYRKLDNNKVSLRPEVIYRLERRAPRLCREGYKLGLKGA